MAVRLDLRPGRRAALGDPVVPDVHHGNLEPALAVGAEVDHLRAVPPTLPVGVVLEVEDLQEAVAVLLRAIDDVAGGPVAQRERRDALELGLQLLAAESGRVPDDVHVAGHRAGNPTGRGQKGSSTTIALTPSSPAASTAPGSASRRTSASPITPNRGERATEPSVPTSAFPSRRALPAGTSPLRRRPRRCRFGRPFQ